MSLEWPIEGIKATGEVTTNEGEFVVGFDDGSGSGPTGKLPLTSYFVSAERLAFSLKLGSVEQIVTNNVVSPDAVSTKGHSSGSLVTVQEKIPDKEADSWLVSHVVAENLPQAFLANDIIVEHVKESLI